MSTLINSLVKAETLAAVFDVFNQTAMTNDERELVAQIQKTTQDYKTYTDYKAKIINLCHSTDVANTVVFGLLAKLCHGRDLLARAILKSNAEKKEALLCVKHIDNLLYEFSDTLKQLNDKSLEATIAEVHEIARYSPKWYNTLIGVQRNYQHVVKINDNLHQENATVKDRNNKLCADYSTLQAKHKHELAKVNLLKREVAQLNKKVPALSTRSLTEENTPQSHSVAKAASPVPVVQFAAVKKRKGEKGNSQPAPPTEQESLPLVTQRQPSPPASKAFDQSDMLELQKSYEAVVKELILLRENLAQNDKLRQKAESAGNETIEKLELEQATSQNWKQISESHAERNANLEGQINNYKSVIQNLQWAAKRQEENLSEAVHDLCKKKAAFAQVKAELEYRSHAPATTVTDKTEPLAEDVLRLLGKIRANTAQLMRNVNKSVSYNIDLPSLMHMIQKTVHGMVIEAEHDIEGLVPHDNGAATQRHVPKTVLPFAHPEHSQAYPNTGSLYGIGPNNIPSYRLSETACLPALGTPLSTTPQHQQGYDLNSLSIYGPIGSKPYNKP